MRADGSDDAIAEAILRGLELAGFDPHKMRGDDVMVFFITALMSVLPELSMPEHERAVKVVCRELQLQLSKRRRSQ